MTYTVSSGALNSTPTNQPAAYAERGEGQMSGQFLDKVDIGARLHVIEPRPRRAAAAAVAGRDRN